MLATFIACKGHAQAPVTAAAKATPAPPAKCLPAGNGYLRARLSGTVNTELNWGNEGTECTGAVRPTDGGIRMPMIVRWPGVVKPGTTSDHVWAFWDFLPTAAELAGSECPQGLDGISIVPTLTGKGDQKTHNFLYWEFHEGGSTQAVRQGNWKAIKATPSAKLELYDVVADPHEDKNVAASNPEMVAKIEEYLKTARTESKVWPLKEPAKKK